MVKRQLNIFQELTEGWLNDARKVAKDKALRDGSVTIMDVLRECPRPKLVSKKAHSKVFTNKLFKKVGYTRSRHPEAHGHVIRVWALTDELRPLASRWKAGVELDHGN